MYNQAVDGRYELQLRDQGFRRIAGIDEAGRGPLAGPVVAACVMLKEGVVIDGANDSKKLRPARREKLYRAIMGNAEVGVGVVREDEIDRINIYNATALAMKKALRKLKTSPDMVLVDGPMKLDICEKHRNIVDGDAKVLSIACASIIAKVTRDRIMSAYARVFPQYGFGKHKGYCTSTHLEALRQNGPCRIHRRSFSPVGKVLHDGERQTAQGQRG